MDFSTQQLVEFALDTDYGSLSKETVHECKRRLIDTFACAMGSYDHPLSESMRKLASQYDGPASAGLWGTSLRTTQEMAAFANGVMLRVGENTDTLIAPGGGGHPSDMISGMVAAAESSRADGRALITAIAIGYEVYGRLMETISIGARGWDQVVHVVLGTVLGAGKLMSLSREQMGHAVSLALTPNMALRQTRHGALSSWKGCAGANATRNALFAATLAKRGVEGPSAIFEGKQGFWSVVGKFEWPSLAELQSTKWITCTSIKALPVCYHTQSAAMCALEVRPQINIEQITEINVETYQTAVEMAAGDQGQWAPRSPESADHSLPFVVATALANGAIDANAFHTDRLDDPKVLGIMKMVKVTANPTLTALWPSTAAARITVRSSTSEVVSSEVIYPKGHVRNPMSDDEVGAKFSAAFGPLVSPDACERALSALWNIDTSSDLALDVLQPLAR